MNIYSTRRSFKYARVGLLFSIAWIGVETSFSTKTFAGCTDVTSLAVCCTGGAAPTCSGGGILSRSSGSPDCVGGVLASCSNGVKPTAPTAGAGSPLSRSSLSPSSVTGTSGGSASGASAPTGSTVSAPKTSAAIAGLTTPGGVAPPPPLPNTPTATTPPPPMSSNIQRGDPYSHYGRGTGDMCSYSDRIDHKYGCDSTYSSLQMANMSNMLSMTTGSMATTAMGQSAQMNAMQQGTQSAALEGAATTQERTGQLQLSIGTMNTLLGAYHIYKGSQHTSNGRQIDNGASNSGGLKVEKVNEHCTTADCNNALQTKIDTESQTKTFREAGTVYTTTGAGSVQDLIIKKYKLNVESGHSFTQVTQQDPEKTHPEWKTGTQAQQTQYATEKAEYERQLNERNQQADSVKRSVASSMQEIGQEATNEQRRVSSMALSGGMMSLMFGSQQMMSGGMGLAAASRLRAAAAALKNNTTGPAITFTPPQNNNFDGGAPTNVAPSTIKGNGIDPNANAASDQAAIPTDAPPDLGKGFNPLPMNSGVPGGPTAGKFNEGSPQGGGGGGGAPVGGSGGTAAEKGQNEDPQAKLAPNEKGTSYESGGTFAAGGGGGKGADGGPDLSGLLAKFLPKKEDAENPRNGILQFGNDAGPDNGNFPALDRNTNIFERIHQTYQEKNSHGMI